MVIYTNWLIPSRFDAITIWPFILIRKSFEGDAALLAHEMVHYPEQAWITPWWWLKYAFSASFRLQAEVAAYRAQRAVGPMSLASAAHWLMRYDASLTLEAALALLQDPPDSAGKMADVA